MKVQGQGARLFTRDDGRIIPATDPCCCGDDEPGGGQGYWRFRKCLDGSLSDIYGYGHSIGGNVLPGVVYVVYYHWGTDQCYYVDAGDAPVWYDDGPPGTAVTINDLWGPMSGTCDNAHCTGTDPPGGPIPPMPPCGCGALDTDTDLCRCEATAVRVTISGTTNCACVDCGSNYEIASTRLSAGHTIDGTYDLPRIGPGEWYLEIPLELDYGLTGSPPCDVPDEPYNVAVWLKKVNTTLWQFVVGVGLTGTNPHDLPDPPVQSVVMFKAAAQGSHASCLHVPMGYNELTCGYTLALFDAGPGDPLQVCNFNIVTGGSASIDACFS